MTAQPTALALAWVFAMQHQTTIAKYARSRFCRNYVSPEDFEQDLMEDVVTHYEQYDPERSAPTSWIYWRARQVALKHKRAHDQQVRVYDKVRAATPKNVMQCQTHERFERDHDATRRVADIRASVSATPAQEEAIQSIMLGWTGEEIEERMGIKRHARNFRFNKFANRVRGEHGKQRNETAQSGVRRSTRSVAVRQARTNECRPRPRPVRPSAAVVHVRDWLRGTRPLLGNSPAPVFADWFRTTGQPRRDRGHAGTQARRRPWYQTGRRGDPTYSRRPRRTHAAVGLSGTAHTKHPGVACEDVCGPYGVPMVLTGAVYPRTREGPQRGHVPVGWQAVSTRAPPLPITAGTGPPF